MPPHIDCPRPEQVRGIFSINPATSFGRTPWRALGPLLSLVPQEQYKAASVAVFAATIPDVSQVHLRRTCFFFSNISLLYLDG